MICLIILSQADICLELFPTGPFLRCHVTKLIFDSKLRRQRQTRIAKEFRTYGFLAERCAQDIGQRLTAINKSFPVVVNLSDLKGVMNDEITSLRESRYISTSETVEMQSQIRCPKLVADDELIPFGMESVDLFISILTFQHVNDLPGVLIQLRRALRPDGLLLAAMFGGETLTELRDALGQAEVEIRRGISPRVFPFVDVRDAGGLLQRAGFALPVVDSDVVTVTYRSLIDLMHDLRGMGQSNILLDRSKRPLSKSIVARAEDIYRRAHADENGKLKATFEILYLTGWAPHESQQKPMRPGTAKARLADALRTKEGKI